MNLQEVVHTQIRNQPPNGRRRKRLKRPTLSFPNPKMESEMTSAHQRRWNVDCGSHGNNDKTLQLKQALGTKKIGETSTCPEQ